MLRCHVTIANLPSIDELKQRDLFQDLIIGDMRPEGKKGRRKKEVRKMNRGKAKVRRRVH